jgi:gliding-associated putative ABC transporter substrate-binding component GldG
MEIGFKKYGWILFIGLLILANIIVDHSSAMIDLTQDKRYSLSRGTIELLENQDQPVLIEILFEGDFPAGYKRLQSGVKDMLRRMKSYCPRMRIVSENPMNGDESEVNSRMENFAKIGLLPLPISYPGSKEFRAVNSFPYVVFSQGQKQVIVPILEGVQVGSYNEEALNTAMAQLEYKFSNAIQKINQNTRKKIAFLTGNSLFNRSDLLGLEKELSKFNQIGRFSLDTVEIIHPQIDVLIITTPIRPYSDKELFAIDQFVLQGGNIVWLLDQYAVSLDSIRNNGTYIPENNLNGLENLLFKYGARINSDLIVDRKCSQIPLVVSNTGGKPQYEFFDWYYHILPNGNQNHIITKNIQDINLYFPSSIDTIRTDGKVNKTVLLSSGSNSKFQDMPRGLSFDILRYPPENDYFDQSSIPVAVLLEGSFSSFYSNRMTSDMVSILQKYELPKNRVGEQGVQLVVSDADFIKTNFAPGPKPTEFPVGYNYFENKIYNGNLELVINTIEYMTGGANLLASKSKVIKLRRLDEVKAQNGSSKWQLINLVLPLVFLVIFGYLFNLWRRKKYTS